MLLPIFYLKHPLVSTTDSQTSKSTPYLLWLKQQR